MRPRQGWSTSMLLFNILLDTSQCSAKNKWVKISCLELKKKNPVFVIVDLFGCLLCLGLYFSSAITGGCLISQTGYYQPSHLSLILDFKNAHTKFPSSLEVRWGCRRLSDTFSAPADPHTPEVPRPFSPCHTLLLSLPLTHSPHSFFYIP